MSDPVKIFGAYFRGRILGQTVYAKETWDSPWLEQKHVHCVNATWAAAPATSSAEMYYRYGPGVFPLNETDRFEWLDPFSLPALAFVRIDFEVAELPDDTVQVESPTITTRSWYGVLGTIVDSVLGSDYEAQSTPSTTYVRQGVQTLIAVGLEWFLRRQYINRSFYLLNDKTTVNQNRVGYGFNTLNGALVKNRSANEQTLPNFSLSHVFQFDPYGTDGDLPEGPKYWSSRDIVRYLLGYHMGRAQDDSYAIWWELEDPEFIVRSTDRPAIQAGGVEVWTVLNQLMAMQRGLGFYLRVTGDTLSTSAAAKVQVVPFSLAPQNVSLTLDDEVDPVTHKLPANSNRKRLDFTRDRTCDQIGIISDAINQYDGLEIIGARATHTFTTYFGETLLGNPIDPFTALYRTWSQALEDEYQTGGSGESNFPPEAEIAQRQRWSAEFRSRHKFRDVYRRYKFDSAVAKDQVYSWTGEFVFPDYDNPVTNPDSLNRKVSYIDLNVLQKVPLYPDVDYSYRDAIELPAVLPEYLDPMVFVRIPVPEGSTASVSGSDLATERWANGESLKLTQDIEGEDEDRNYHMSLHIQAPGIPNRLDFVVSGQPQHVRALDYPWQTWDKPIGRLATSKDDLLLTIAVEADYHCRVVYYGQDWGNPPPSDADTLTRIRTIYVGDDYRMDFICKNTVWGIENGELLQADSAYLIRDDRPKLKQLAEIAWVWYGKTRRALDFKTQFLTNALEIGDMITGIIVQKDGTSYDDFEVFTTVSSISISSPIGEVNISPPEISYKTEFGQFDPVTFFQI